MEVEMGAALSLIPELEDVIQHGTREKRADTLHRITALFLDGAETYRHEHVELFDDVFGLLIVEIETKARARLSSLLAPVDNAPVRLLRTLANDDDITVAGPVLTLAPRLGEADLVDIAETKSQAHLQAITARKSLGETVTDVLVRRGDRDVARDLAGNRGARISEAGFIRLVERAEDDGVLAEKVGLRPDIPAPMFRDLLSKATSVVRERLMPAAPPELKIEIGRVLEKVSKEVGAEVRGRVGPRDYQAAQRLVLGLHRAGRLNEATVMAFCSEGKYEETVVSLAALAKVPVNVADRLMNGERPDPVLILCKAIGLAWPTVRAVITLRQDATSTNKQALNAALDNYGRLSSSTAQRVVRFWQLRQRTA
jgi:uncharacterized protein (DUF2336 family)